MKLIAFILSVYILTLTALPCIDATQDCAECTMDITQNTSNQGHQQHADMCSPFCTCACCATPVIQMDYSVHFNSFSILQFQYPDYKSSFPSSIFASIWQPPKLS